MICGMSIVATIGTTSIGQPFAVGEEDLQVAQPGPAGIDISCTDVTPREAASAAARSWSSCTSWSSSAADAHRPSRSTASS